VTAGICAGWAAGYLLNIGSQGTELRSPGVMFYATFVGVMAALAVGAAVLHGRSPQWAQTLLYAAAGGLHAAGFLGLASIGLPLIVATLLSLTAAGSRVIPARRGLAAGLLSAGVFVVGFAATVRVS
jgi:hypothetical protein